VPATLDQDGGVGRPRTHDTDAMLDAARAIALEQGARAVTVEAIAARSGAPVGSLYHRFGSRDALLAATWERALARFQPGFVDALHGEDPVAAALAGARWILAFAREQPDDARLLAAFRPADVLGAPGGPAAARLQAGNEQILGALRELARPLPAARRARGLDVLSLAVVDITGGAVRRRLLAAQPIDEAFEEDVLAAVVAVLGRLDVSGR
jgi:AcrR family transcriptional regulator